MRFSTFSALTAVALLVLVSVPIGATPTATNATNSTTGSDLTDRVPQTVPDRLNNTTATSPTASPSPTATSTASTPVPSTPIESNGTRIDSQTVIVESEYRENESVALLTIRSRATQVVTFSDGGRFREGGQVPVTAEPFRAGETATIEIPVTEVDGWVGVAISTERTRLYSEIVKQPSGGGLDILTALSSLQAWFAGVIVAFTWMVIAGYNVLRREDGSPRVAT